MWRVRIFHSSIGVSLLLTNMEKLKVYKAEYNVDGVIFVVAKNFAEAEKKIIDSHVVGELGRIREIIEIGKVLI